MAGRYGPERANQIIDSGYADLVACGRSFIAGPALPRASSMAGR